MDNRAPAVDVGGVLDQGAWSGLQKTYVFIVALAVVIDGFDNQVLGLTIPALMKAWGVERGAFASVLALQVIGQCIGTAIGGWMGDRIGRRSMLLLCVLVFGVVTGITMTTDTIGELTILRVLAGLGLGGAMPNAVALLTEFSPARRQALAVTLGIACIPVGGFIGGQLSAALIPTYGWHAMYIFGGIAPIVVALALWAIVPESPRYLASQPNRWPHLATVLNRLLKEERFGADTQFRDTIHEPRAPLKAILASDYRHNTLALWAAYFTNLLAVYTFFNWGPQMLSQLGLAQTKIGFGMSMYNLGSVLGALLGVWLFKRFPATKVIGVLCGCAVIGGLAFSHLQDETAIFVLLALEGAFTSGVQILLFAVAAASYPTQIRSTGVGSALGVGRTGAIVSTFAGNYMLALDSTGKSFFLLIAGVMAFTLISVLQVRKKEMAAPV